MLDREDLEQFVRNLSKSETSLDEEIKKFTDLKAEADYVKDDLCKTYKIPHKTLLEYAVRHYEAQMALEMFMIKFGAGVNLDERP